MRMDEMERKAKKYLKKLLRSQGYATYARIFEKFDFFWTDDPSVVAYMSPSKGFIMINKSVDSRQASVLVRHEILHAYLRHEKRLIHDLIKRRGLDPDELDDVSLHELVDEIKNVIYADDTFNRAADYEISNRGYTEKDKEDVRNIELNGRILTGLVTEDDHPEWVDLSLEEMYELLEKEKENAELTITARGFLIDETTFVDPTTGVVYGA